MWVPSFSGAHASLNLLVLILWSANTTYSLNSTNAAGAPNNSNKNSIDFLLPLDLNKYAILSKILLYNSISSSAGVWLIELPEYVGVVTPNILSRNLSLSSVLGVANPNVWAKFLINSLGILFLPS